jgi:catechol 2,3-dioxygenase-like lactoylglutathione lyase family enzyme
MLEHVNLRTTNMQRLEEWYTRILGLKKGYRPPFGVEGRWMYVGDVPTIHLLQVEQQPQVPEPRMEHFCLRALGLKTFLDRLDAENIPYETIRVPELHIFQVCLSDPDGNHMHIDFPPEEGNALSFE